MDGGRPGTEGMDEETLIHGRRSSASLSPETAPALPGDPPGTGRVSEDDVALSQEWGVDEEAVCWLREHGLLHLGAALRDAGVIDTESLVGLNAEGARRVGLSTAEYQALSEARSGLDEQRAAEAADG